MTFHALSLPGCAIMLLVAIAVAWPMAASAAGIVSESLSKDVRILPP